MKAVHAHGNEATAIDAPAQPRRRPEGPPGQLLQLQRTIGNRAAAAVVQRYINAKAPEDLFGLEDLKKALLDVIGPYNKRDEAVQPDFYGNEFFTQGWYDQQTEALRQLEKLMVPGLADRTQPHVQAVLKQLAANVSAEKKRLATMFLQNPPMGKAPLPAELHFIWSGRAISKFAFNNILHWAKRAAAADWTLNVWTDAADNTWSVQVLMALKEARVRVKMINQGTLDERLWPAYQTLIEGRSYPAASDLARYSILKTHGGIYVDVDIAPGKLELSPTPVKAPPIPTLSPEIRDTAAVREEHDLRADAKVTESMVRDVASRRLAKGQHNNSFIMSSAGSLAIEAVIKEVVGQLGRRQGGAQYVVQNQAATAAITGPAAVKRGFYAYLRESIPNLDEVEAMDVLNEALGKVPDLDWVTPESEAQEH